MKKIFAMTALFVTTASSALAETIKSPQEIRRSAQEYFERLDTNDDGVVTRAEYDSSSETDRNTFAAEKFSAADANGDGTLSLQEMTDYKMRDKTPKDTLRE